MSTAYRIFLAIALLTLGGCAHVVPPGHEGVKVFFGTVEADQMPSGLYWVSPFTTIHDIDIRTQKWDSKTETYTKDVQEATVSFTLNYFLKPEAVGTTYRTVGVDWAEKLVGQQVHQYLKNVVGQYEATNLIAHRQEVTEKAAVFITTALAQRGVEVPGGGFTVTDISFTQTFDKAVEAKVVAQQQAEQAQNLTEKIRQEAAQKVISATAEAQSMKIRADALAQNPKLVEWEAVQKWNGELPTYMLGGGVPFIQVPQGK